MHDHLMSANAFENAGVGSRFAAHIMLRLQTIDGYHNIEPLNARPLWWNLTKRTGYHLDVNTPVLQQRQKAGELTMAHQRIAPHAFVLELTQVQSSNMPIFKCVTSGAMQRTLPRNFNRKRRPSAAQDALPSLNDFACLHISSKIFGQPPTSRSAPLWLMPEKSKVALRVRGDCSTQVRKRINKALRRSS